MIGQMPDRAEGGADSEDLQSPWLSSGTELKCALYSWKRNVTPCFRADDWHTRISDAAHFRIATNAVSPPAFKLLYDSYVWSRVLAACLWYDPADNVLELLPGSSLTIPLALKRAGQTGHLYRADLTPQVPLPAGLDLATTWLPGDVFGLAKFPGNVVLGNHILDDLIATLHFGPCEYYSRIYGNPREERHAWATIERSPLLSRWITEVVCFIRRLLQATTGLRLFILREYPATVAIEHTNAAHIAVHLACYKSVIAECRTINGTSVWHADQIGREVPEGARHLRSFLLLAREPCRAMAPRDGEPCAACSP
jgi:hypothetical protein